jgi:putative transcriptional regulator
MHTVVETPPYLADAERLFSADECTAIVEIVAGDPLCGVVIPGSGGIRKVRFGFGGRGSGICKERKVRSDREGKDGSRQGRRTHAEELPEARMSKRAFDKIMSGLDDARAFLDGTADKRRYRVHVPENVDVKKIRTRLGLSQETFAATYGFAVSAVRDWEQGRRRPERSARILLKIVEKEPEAVTRALAR